MLGKLVDDIDIGIRHKWALNLASKVFDVGASIDQSQLLGDLYVSRGDHDWAVSFGDKNKKERVIDRTNKK